VAKPNAAQKIHDAYDPGHYVHGKGNRYDEMVYRRCGRSGLQLPAISLGLWHNFDTSMTWKMGRMLRRSFDLALPFDLANNYGPPLVRLKFRRLYQQDWALRDELIISTKPVGICGRPYGNLGSGKYLLSV
jgi:L-glyceraldehyde 3-phosphate reductase